MLFAAADILTVNKALPRGVSNQLEILWLAAEIFNEIFDILKSLTFANKPDTTGYFWKCSRENKILTSF